MAGKSLVNVDILKKNKMLPYKELVDKLKKDYARTRIYQIDNFAISISGIDNSANYSSTNVHVFDAYKQISTYVKGNDFYKGETKGFEMQLEFRIGNIISNMNMVSKKTDGKIKVRIINFKIGLLTVPLDLEKDIIVKEQRIRILKLNKIRSIKRFKRFFYYIVYKLYNIVNKIKEN